MLMIITTQWRRKTSEDSFINIHTSHFICKGTKRVIQGLHVRGSWRSNRTAIFWPSLLWPSRCVFLVLLMLKWRSRGPLCWVLAFFTASYQHLLWTPIQSGPLRAPSAGCGFSYHISSISVSNSTGIPTVCNSTGPAHRTQLSLDFCLDWAI